MKLFSYYAWHSLVNQIRKLFKTWVLVFILVCGLMGGLIGFGAGVLTDAAEAEQPEETVTEEEPGFLEQLELTPMDAAELAAGAAVLLIFVFSALSADKNGSKIFLPADVPLLFASPMKPQSVLMFRLGTQMGIFVVAGFYIPNLVINFGLNFSQSVAVLVFFVVAVLMSKLLQVLLYTLCATHRSWKAYLRKGIYALLAVIGMSYFLFWKLGSIESPLKAAVAFFNGEATCLIPIWGWIKGICVFGATGEAGKLWLCLLATALAAALLCRIIWGIDADFYEDAMAKSEETAELMAKAQSEKSSGVAATRKRKKDRSEKLRRDGMDRGSGAVMFFHKSLYNRFRFAHLGFFTKTMETYLVTACVAAAFCRFVVDMSSGVPVALVLSGFVFFRALGNPMVEDTQMDFFRLIPESTWSKLFWSALAGSVNCVLDLILPMLAASVVLWVSPLQILMWLPFAVSVDLYATAVGAFIDLSVPVSAGKMVKQFVQVLFVYFGLLPDVAIIAVGFVFHFPVAAVLASAAVNVGLGLLFLTLAATYLEPKGGKLPQTERVLPAGVQLEARKRFSGIGIAVFLLLVVTTALQLLLSYGLQAFAPGVLEQEWILWALTFGSQYLVGVPVCLAFLKKVPASSRSSEKVTLGKGVITLFICIFFMYAGNLIGTAVNAILSFVLSTETINPVETFAMNGSLPVRILFMVILAPCIEEYIFRGQLIDRMRPYGGKLAVLTSAAMFGLFHGNFSQMFYAFGLGLVFGYVYLHTGKLRYSTLLHMFINFCGSIVAPALLMRMDSENMASAWNLAFGGYVMLMIGGSIVGLVLFCVYRKQLQFDREPMELPRKGSLKIVWGNPGMILLVLGCLGLVLMNIFGV